MSGFRTQYTVAFSDADKPDDDPIFEFTFDHMPPLHAELDIVHLWIVLDEPDNVDLAGDFQIIEPPDISYYIVDTRPSGYQGIHVSYKVRKVSNADA